MVKEEKTMNYENLLNAIREDFNRNEYKYLNRDWIVIEGRKYAKIVSTEDGKQYSAWGFVQLQDDKKFKAGDILKSASWATPVRNFARGNVISEQFGDIRYTGAM
jgi:hypothetical protein